MAVVNEVDEYMLQIENIADSIHKLDAPFGKQILKTTLCFSMIDTVSQAAFSEESKNRVRFIKFMDQILQWDHRDSISIPQLKYALDQDMDQGFRDLKECVNENYSGYEHGRILYVDCLDNRVIDRQVRGLWPEGRRVLEKFSVESFTYKHLMYTLRNSLAHELRYKGQAMDMEAQRNAPYYYGMLTATGTHTWELYIPSGFLSDLLLSSRGRLKQHFLEHEINPYNTYKRGSLWL